MSIPYVCKMNFSYHYAWKAILVQLLVAGTLLLAFCSDKEKKISLIKVSSARRDVVRVYNGYLYNRTQNLLGL